MEHDREERLKKEIWAGVSSVYLSEERAEQILADVHQQMRERSKIMRYSKKRTGFMIAAALIVMGAVTAVAAGKVAYTSSGVSVDDQIASITEFTSQAKAALGQEIKIPEEFSGGASFTCGYLMDVDAWDDSGNKVGSYPEANARYVGEKGVDLSVTKPLEWAEKEGGYQVEETYGEIKLCGKSDQYLFLPPDQEPSAEDKKLEEEGKLMISYGSSEEERKVFHSVSWKEGELQYLLYTFEDVELEDLIAMAKETIDTAR